MRKIFVVLLIVFFSLPFTVKAQTTELWGGYISTVKINERFSIWNDWHYVTDAFFASRHGLTYNLHRYALVSAGYAYVTTATPFTNDFVRDENRIWWQVVGRQNITNNISYRYRWRHDLRYRQALDGTEVSDLVRLNQRTRLLADFRFILKRLPNDRRIHFDVMNEFLYQWGRHMSPGVDQNRFYLMGGYSTTNVTVLGGFSLRSIYSGPQIRHQPGFTVWVIHSIRRRQEVM
ncbi:MAG: DUF2490 domain-containing protein [Flavobacteriales bacterium]|nr:MAG: DUF2490 domain-containing protein [Flavobacteriales bacterium]